MPARASETRMAKIGLGDMIGIQYTTANDRR